MNDKKEELELRIEQLEKDNLMLRKKLKESKSNFKKVRASFLEKILDNIPSDLVVFDIDHKYIFLNELAVKDPVTRAWLIGKDDYDYCTFKGWSRDIADKRRAVFNSVLESESEVSFEEELLTPQGEKVWNLRRMYPVFDQSMSIQYVFGYASDITYLKETEENLELERLKSEKSMKAKEQFLANMSHEIRTPMNAIAGLAKLLESASLNQKEQSFLKGIQKSSKSLGVIINDILDFSKINEGKLKMEEVEVDLMEVIGQLRLLFEMKCSEKDLVFSIEVDQCLQNVLCHTDPTRLEQVLNNLLSNAVKFTYRGTVQLKVKCIATSGGRKSILFVVSDTGIGIAEDKKAKIFEPFEQADYSTTRNFGGTGLGLAISSKLVNLLGGDLVLNSIEGSGSEFSFQLDFIYNEVSDKGDAALEKSEEYNKFEFEVLLVEDNPLNQLYAESLLIDLGCTVEIASNGEEAIDFLKKRDYDIVLMDIQMPVMGGEECLMKLRLDMGLKVPVLACTANAFKSDVENYLEAGFDDVLPKPFTIDEMKLVLKKIGDYQF